MRVFRGGTWILALSTLRLAAAPTPTRAQDVKQVITPRTPTAAQGAASAVTSRQVSNVELAEAIQRSGLTHETLRARLQAAGYDPALADPFFSSSAGVTTPEVQSPSAIVPSSTLESTAPDPTVSAFQALGLIAPGAESNPSSAVANVPAPSPANRGTGDASQAVFGKDVFNNASNAFDPIAAGPVDPSYRLGAGDQLQFILTGDTEKGYQIEVRRDGTVLIPELGQIAIGGLTMDAARAVLRRRAGSAYSGIHTGTTRLDVSVQRVRSNAVFVIGEVEHPGVMVVNALSTTFHALTKAGGPTARGSFRNIEVRRGGEIVRRLDLYRYLLDGDASSDLRTEHGDVIFVPLALRTVRITGAVRRPGTFELLPHEGFSALLRFVGGMLPAASLARIQIDRILPAEQRGPGTERAIIDVRLGGSLDSLSLWPLHDGDVVTVFFVGDLRRNSVVLRGEVLQPGTYEFEPGLTLKQLIDRAQGLLPWALSDRVKIIRGLPESGKREELSLDLATVEVRNFALKEFDQVIVLDGREHAGGLVIGGAVWHPGTLLHNERQTLRDVIDAAGGVKPEASVIVVSRKRVGRSYSDTTSHLHRFDVGEGKDWEFLASQFTMEYDDNVYVLSSPGVRDQRFVSVEGLFAFPGTYAINEGVDRIADVIRRAGSPLPNAYHGNFRLRRNELQMPVDLDRALKGDHLHNVLLLHGDRLFIGPNPSTVLVAGEVGRTVLVLHRPGLTLRDYVELAGGPTAAADLSRATVEELSGTVGRSKRRFVFFWSNPPVTPGAKVTVPPRSQPRAGIHDVLNTTLQYASVLASLAIAYAAVVR